MVEGRGGLLHLQLLLAVVEHDLVGLPALGLSHLHTFVFSLTGRGRGGLVSRIVSRVGLII